MSTNNKLVKISLALILGMAVFLGACGETEVSKSESTDSQDDSNTDQEEAKAEESADSAESAEDQVFKLGDTVSIEDSMGSIDLTITGASFTEPTEYTEAVNGKVLTLEVTVENTGDEQVFVDSTDFAVYNSEGSKLDDYYGYDEMAISDNLNSGKNLSGKMYFDVSEQDSYELIYTPFFSMESKEITFDIAVK
ncbi:hypothetical protein OBCHQ24_15615 [Oceanobacillus iheyensis]|nr:hypothetical protein OBCHQ24_15615 [Oceanobacillus iheyensis]